MATALQIIRKRYPNVTEVSDAKRPVTVDVTREDNRRSKIKNHQECAMATALKRQYRATGVLVSLKTAYIIRGKKAIRFVVPHTAQREIVSFDRKAGFQVGSYHLNAPSKQQQLGSRSKRETSGLDPDRDHKGNGTIHNRFKQHTTVNVRPRL